MKYLSLILLIVFVGCKNAPNKNVVHDTIYQPILENDTVIFGSFNWNYTFESMGFYREYIILDTIKKKALFYQINYEEKPTDAIKVPAGYWFYSPFEKDNKDYTLRIIK